MTSLVTGPAGFVGSHVVRALLARGEPVRALVRATSDVRNLSGLELELAHGDVRDVPAVAAAMAGCDVVYHVAGLYTVREKEIPDMYSVNVGGTKCVLRAALAAGVRRAVLTSTIGAIGRPEGDELRTEETAFNLWDTASNYVKSKVLGEVAARELAEEGLPLIIVHPCAPIGPGDIKPTVTGQRIVDVLNGKLPSYAPGGINCVAVQDVAEGHVLAAERGRPGERYILGNAQGNLSLDEFLHLVEQAGGPAVALPEPPAVRTPRRGRKQWPSGARPVALTADPGKAIRELGLPQTPLVEAFREAVAWFRAKGYVTTDRTDFTEDVAS